MTSLTQHPDLQCLNAEQKFDKQFSFCTLVTRYDEYLEMVDSAKQAGFSGNDVEFLYFDNKISNQYDGYSGINKALRAVQGKYLIFCHQDILFKFDTRAILEQRIRELEALDAHWAVAGNAGKNKFGQVKIRISDAGYSDLKEGSFPSEVMTLDENFLIINRQENIACSPVLSGFHIYGTDLCQNASALGLKNYVIDFHLYHKSPGRVDQSYFDAQKAFMQLQYHRKQSQFIWAMCSSFFVSSSKFLLFFCNKYRILRWARTIHKRRSRV